MVEGPGCKLKGIKIKAKLKGQTVLIVKGNAVNKQAKKQSDGVTAFHQLIGLQLEDVQTLGKELFMYFGKLCLRVHFLMSGQCFINSQKVDNDMGGKAETATLEIQMSRDLLTFRNSSVDIRPAEPCKQKFNDLNDLDICSPVFNFKRAVALVKEQQGRQICDVLLDQLILPGVGNIIKNEALFDSGIRPSSKIEELKEEHITHLIKMTRDFTNIFYMCRRDGKPLYPYYKIYSKRKCKQCEGKVTITRLGDDSERVTYYCENCQTNDLKKSLRTLPKKNSLLGWVTTSADGQSKSNNEWSCVACTLLNPSNKIQCNVCETPREINQPVTMTHKSDLDNTKLSSSIFSETDRMRLSSSANDSPLPRPGMGIKRPSEDSISQPPKKIVVGIDTCSPKLNYRNDTFLRQSPGTSRNEKTFHINNRTVISGNCPGGRTNLKNLTAHHKTSISKSSSELKRNELGNRPEQSSESDAILNKIPPCPTHKKKCSMKEVHKKGDNYGRWFFSCPLRMCNFFEWADTRFPLCPDHGKPCTIRTVMKVGPNNGRKFFACKMPRNKQCKFFEWAHGYD